LREFELSLSFSRLFNRVDLIKPLSNVRLCISTYVRTSVRPQNVPSISMKFGLYVEVDEWCTIVCSITQSTVMVKVMRPSKLEIGHFQQLSPLPFTMEAGNWPQILKPMHNIYIWSGLIFDIFPSFCVMWLWTWHKCQFRRVDRQSHMGLIYFSVVSVVTDAGGLWLLIYSVSYISAADVAAWQSGRCNDAVSSLTTETRLLPSPVE